jgi:glucose/arabinose dehydrogenase
MEAVAEGLSFPTGVCFDHAGAAVVAESGLPFGGARPGGRLWRLGAGGERRLLADGLAPPVNGVVHHDGELYVSVGGHPSGIVAVSGDGARRVVLDGLPGPGNYQTNMAVVGPDYRLYFSQGAMTNSGIVGLDAYQVGWLARLPHAHDVPGIDVVLTGVNVCTPNPLGAPGDEVETGAFVPFGTPTEAGQRIAGRVPCTAAVLRCGLDGSGLELVAWGLRNAYGLGFLPDGRLLAVDQGADDRGSRPVGNAPDLLYEVHPGAWYGWPDFVGGEPVTDERFRPTRGPSPSFLLADHHRLPPPQRPLLAFPAHSAAVKLAVAPGGHALAGDVLVALFGDEAPMTAPAGPPVGRGVVRVDPADWSVRPLGAGPFLRPIDVAFHPGDGSLHVLDFGRFEMTAGGVEAEPGTGTLWRVTGAG